MAGDPQSFNSATSFNVSENNTWIREKDQAKTLCYYPEAFAPNPMIVFLFMSRPEGGQVASDPQLRSKSYVHPITPMTSKG